MPDQRERLLASLSEWADVTITDVRLEPTGFVFVLAGGREAGPIHLHDWRAAELDLQMATGRADLSVGRNGLGVREARELVKRLDLLDRGARDRERHDEPPRPERTHRRRRGPSHWRRARG